MRGVTFLVTGELIARALAMPEGTEIKHIALDDPFSNTFRFYVSHEDLPDIREGEQPREIIPVITTKGNLSPRDWLKFDWMI